MKYLARAILRRLYARRAEPAPNTAPKSRPSGAINTDLTARAMSLNNKDRARAQRYLKTHAILSKGASIYD